MRRGAGAGSQSDMTTTSGDLRTFESLGGARVTYRRWLPDGDVRGTVQIVHAPPSTPDGTSGWPPP